MAHSARWNLTPTRAAETAALAQALNIGLPAARVLAARGFTTPEDARRFLKPRLSDLHDPYLLHGVREAVDRIRRAIATSERVLIYGDYDVDGATSVVVLKKAMELAGGNPDWYVPNRLKDGYGMRPDVIEKAAAEGVRLIVSVDTGIRAAEVVRCANALGIDVIITDHHLPEAELPPACAVLNPNQPGCAYPEKNLCGVGVAFKLVQALLATLDWPSDKLERILSSFLKLVAIGTVADVVSLTGENRIFVRFGLSGLKQVRNPGLRALLDVAGFTGDSIPSATQVAFRIAPRMNAAGRMDTADSVIDLFLTGDPARARELAQQLHDHNTERQQTEAEIVQRILEECERAPVGDDQAALVFSAPGWHKGVLGIVASRLVERFHRPAFVLSEGEDGLASGSGRSLACFHLLDALESMPELFTKFGGHKAAAGLTLRASDVPTFRERFNAYASARLTPADFVPQIAVDAPLDLNEVNSDSVSDILSLAPFGFGNPAPLFLVSGAEITGPPAVMKEKHLRVPLRHAGRMLVVKAWNFAERAAELQPGMQVDAVISLEEDAYSAGRGYDPWCAVLRDVRPATTSAAVSA